MSDFAIHLVFEFSILGKPDYFLFICWIAGHFSDIVSFFINSLVSMESPKTYVDLTVNVRIGAISSKDSVTKFVKWFTSSSKSSKVSIFLSLFSRGLHSTFDHLNFSCIFNWFSSCTKSYWNLRHHNLPDRKLWSEEVLLSNLILAVQIRRRNTADRTEVL